MSLISERINALLKEQKRSQRWLAIEIGASPQNVNGWVKGEYEPSRKNIKLIADALKVSVEYLEGDKDKNKENFTGYQQDNNQLIKSDIRKDMNIESNVKVTELVGQYYRHVPLKAQAGYAIGVYEPLKITDMFYRKLPIDLPNPETYLCFDIADNSMETPLNDFKGVHDGDTIICKEVPVESLLHSAKNKIYIVVLKPTDEFTHGAVLVKMFTGIKEGVASFDSTTHGYPDFKINANDIQKLYSAKVIVPKYIYL